MPITSGNGDTTKGDTINGLICNVDYVTQPSGSTPGVVAGLINSDPQKITKTLAATTPTPVPGDPGDPKKMVPTELCTVTAGGTIAYRIFHATGSYTKP